MSSPEDVQGLRPPVPEPSPDSDACQQEREIMFPLDDSRDNSNPRPENIEEHSLPSTGAATSSRKILSAYDVPSTDIGGDHRACTPSSVPASSSGFEGKCQAVDPVENPSADNIFSLEFKAVQHASCPLSGGTSLWETESRNQDTRSVSSKSSSLPSTRRENECILPGSASERVGGERLAFTPLLVPSSSAGQFEAAQQPRSESMPSQEVAMERLLSEVDSGTASRSTPRILSKVNTGGRIRLDKGEVSEDLAQNVGEHFDQRTLRKHAEFKGESSGKTDKLSFYTSESVPLVPRTMPLSPPRSVISRENERLVRNYREVPVKFQTWDGMKNIARQVWMSFMNWNNRSSLKRIKASPPILRTYHDSILHGEVPANLQARTRIRAGWIGFLWHIVEFLIGVVSATLYVYSTYHKDAQYNWVGDVQESISVAFLADYLFRLYTETSRFYYIFSLWGAIDFLSLIPVILLFREDIAGADFIKLLYFVRVVRIFTLINNSHVGRSVNQQIILLSIGTFGAFLVDAAIIQWIEYYTAPTQTRNGCPEEGCLSFWGAFYFVFVTVGTIGFGDITPKTGLGQFVTCVTIVLALTIIPIRVGEIMSLAYLSPYGGSVSSRKLVGSRFLILSGGISLLAVQNFLAEFFKRTHQQEFDAFPVQVVIMGSHEPSFDLKQVLSQYHGKAEFIEGSPLRVEDLERVKAHKAMAILLVAYQETKNASLEDAAQIMRALAVHRFCRSHGSEDQRIRIIVEVLNPATQRSAVWDEKYSGSIEVICPTKLHYKLMARSCFVRGLYTLITNLFTSELRLKHLDERDFLSEYFSSFDNEIYPVILAPAFYNLPFEEVAEIIFEMFNSTIVALDTPVCSQGRIKREVLLFPKGRLIRPDDVGLIITNDLKTAYAVSRFQSSDQSHPNAVSDIVKFFKRFKGSLSCTERNVEEVGLLRRVRLSLDKPGTVFTRVATMRRDSSFGTRDRSVFPEDTESEFGLETQFREAIQEVYTQQEYPEWRTKPPAEVEHISTPTRDMSQSGSHSEDEVYSDSDFRFPRSVSLENAAERLLAWPPLRINAPPHPAVLERREKEILDNLKERTLSFVAFNIPHILVCCQIGWPSNFFYFHKELRNPKSANPPVVILYPEDPSHVQWGCVGMFDNVYFLKGSPKYELDLMRSGVIQAARIVILANQGQPVDVDGSAVMDDRFANRGAAAYTSDIGNIVVAANVQRLYGDKVVDKVIVEMQHANAFHFLRPHYKIPFSEFRRSDFRRNSEALIHFGPPYMEGKATSLTMLGFLMRASFFNRNTISILEQLIMGGFALTEDGLSSDRQRILEHIEVPQGYANKTFQRLFTHLLHESNMLAIGLYRVRGNLGAPTSYVLTNPRKGCIVNPDDLVYVIT